jgi:uncharacterized membrane protein YhaH (DUF805 family)
MEWMLLPLKRYAQTSGRSPRREFWMWILFLFVAQIILAVLDSVFGLGGSTEVQRSTVDGGGIMARSYGTGTRGGVLSGLFSIATFVPNFTVTIRRLHDVDRSGWWLLLPLAPALLMAVLMFASSGILVAAVGLLIAAALIIQLVWYCSHGTRGPNRFGPDPYGGLSDLEETFR